MMELNGSIYNYLILLMNKTNNITCQRRALQATGFWRSCVGAKFHPAAAKRYECEGDRGDEED